MATLKARLFLIVAYFASVAAVVSVERYWHESGGHCIDNLSSWLAVWRKTPFKSKNLAQAISAPSSHIYFLLCLSRLAGFQFSELLSRNDYVSAMLVVFAVIGIIFTALIVAAGVVSLATRALANHGCDGSCPHRDQRRQLNDNPNNIDVSVQPTDTTVAGALFQAPPSSTHGQCQHATGAGREPFRFTTEPSAEHPTDLNLGEAAPAAEPGCPADTRVQRELHVTSLPDTPPVPTAVLASVARGTAH
ncbi:hypothetical protein HPB50_009731 [Hyalomma asiaticum]|uniref:Uncharacterized protein n=1 Tax=Hyalomma asiaticum TaxID=266040 RepID=A0ACB7TEZ1_HYAAI|nr:hypothetical protein HPB50_009731 [Hyalomma asiaticum]